MKSVKELEQTYRNELQVFKEHEIFKRQPVNTATGFINSLLVITANLAVRPLKYVYLFYLGETLKRLNRVYFRSLIQEHERSMEQVSPEDYKE